MINLAVEKKPKKGEQEIAEKQGELAFSREQILSSKKLQAKYSVDILRVILKPDKKYSLAEVGELVKEFKERVI